MSVPTPTQTEEADFWNESQLKEIRKGVRLTLKAIVVEALPDLFDIAAAAVDSSDEILEQIVADATEELKGLL